MTEREGWKLPVCAYEQSTSHRMHPVHRSGVILKTFLMLVLVACDPPAENATRPGRFSAPRSAHRPVDIAFSL